MGDKSPLFGILPPQDISLKKKTDVWWKHCVDQLEWTARNQYWAKKKLSKNYRLANGEFLPEDYADPEEEDFDLLSYFSKESEYPFAKNYDIISQPLNTLLGEMDAMPDEFDVVGRGDIFDNEKELVRKQMLDAWFVNQAMQNAMLSLEEDGFSLEGPFESEEEYQQVQQLYQEKLSIRTPPEIEKYMKTQYRNVVEVWGSYEMKDQFERFNIKHQRNIEFFHFLVAGERHKHIFYDGSSLKTESLNPRYTFFHKNPNNEYIQDGNIAGFLEILSLPAIIDKYGHELSENDFEELSGTWDKKYDPKKFPRTIAGKPVDFLDPLGRPYQTKMLTDDPYINQFFPKMKDASVGTNIYMDEIERSKIDGYGGGFPYGMGDMCVVVTGYWRSIEKIGKLTWINPITGLFEIREIDETFVVPSYIKVDKTKKPSEQGELNTIIWARRTVIYQGKKISNYYSDPSTGSLRKPIYFSMRRADIQIGKLPIGGQLANNIGTVPTSFVDRVKNLQFLHNVAMNQGMKNMMEEIAPFVVAESNIIPDGKDWGDNAFIKWLGIGDAYGVAPVDTSPGNNGGGSVGNTFPKMVDLDRTQRIMTRFNIATVIRQLAWESVGITPQRLGSIKASETATGVNEAVTRSHSQTSGWFTDFFDCEKQILQMQLDAAKYLQGNQMEHTAQYVKSDYTMESIRITKDLNLYTLHLYVTNNREHARQLDFARRMAIENNTSEMAGSERLKLGTSGNLREIYISMKDAEEKMLERMQQEHQQQLELEQQKLEQAEQNQQQQVQMFYDKLENDLRRDFLKALGFQSDSDVNKNSISDVVEQANLFFKDFELRGKQEIAQGQLNLQQESENNKVAIENAKIAGQDRQRAHELRMKAMDEKIARINDKGKYNNK